MTVRKGKVIVDTNLLMNALDFRKCDVFSWLDEVYEDIYIHIVVVNEFKVDAERKSILAEVQNRGWKLFDHNDRSCLPDNQKALYSKYVTKVREGFENLKAKKEAEGKVPKTSNNLGEIHSLALAQFISANIISSNDFEIREVINDEIIKIYSEYLEEDVYIEQDTLEDFCAFCAQSGVAKPSDIIKFFKVCHCNDTKDKLETKVASLKHRLIEYLK